MADIFESAVSLIAIEGVAARVPAVKFANRLGRISVELL